MADELRTEVEQVKEREDVKQALKQTTSTEPKDTPKARTKGKLWLGTHAIILLAELNAAPDRVMFPKTSAR